MKNIYVIFICNYDPFGCDRVKYTIRNMCEEDPEMPYEDGARTIVLYTRGKEGEVSEELRQFLNYMEHTREENAVNPDLKEIQKMVDTVKQDREVSVAYMKGFERDRLMYEEGREEGRELERKNTEKERERAEKENLRANAAERELQNLKAKLEQMMRLQEKKEARLPFGNE